MRIAIVLAAGMLMTAGCNLYEEPGTQPTKPVSGGEGPAVAPGPGGGVVMSAGGGGGGGAVQAVRGAAARTVAMNDLNNLRIFVENASLASGQMPTKAETLQAVKQADPKLGKQLEEGDIVLTGVQQREGIWAYSKEPQGGQHIVLSNNGVERLTADQLRQRLQNQ